MSFVLIKASCMRFFIYFSVFFISFCYQASGSQISEIMTFIADRHVYGNRDDHLSYKEAKKLINTRKLEMTCESISNFTIQYLRDEGFYSRFILSLMLSELNGYNNAHSIIEIFDEKQDIWNLWDICLKCYFTVEGRQINGREFCEISSQNDYEIVRFSHSSIIQEKDSETWFGIFFSSEDGLRKFYKRTCQIECIRYRGIFYFTIEDEYAPRISAYPYIGATFEYLPKWKFNLKFYHQMICPCNM